MSRNIIYPYKMGSKSSRLLRDNLDAIRVYPDRRYRYRHGDFIINWGNSTVPNWVTEDAIDNMLNKPINVGNASNKIRCFKALSSSCIPTLDFTTDRWVAEEWKDQEKTVYVRKTLQGHSGAGIEVSTSPSERLPDAPLYTLGKENCGEYRVHVFNGKVIDYRKKSRKEGDDPTDEQSDVRTHGNGWIYRMGDLRRLERIEELAKDAIKALGLDFGAVDIIMDENGDVFVIEVNTACGLVGTTLDNYLVAINEYLCQEETI